MFKRATQPSKPTNTKINMTATLKAAMRAVASFEELYKYDYFIDPDEVIMGPIDQQGERIVWFIQNHNPQLDQYISLSFKMERREYSDGKVDWGIKDAVYGYRTQDGQQVGYLFEVLSVRRGGYAPWVFAPPIEGDPDPEYLEYVHGYDDDNRRIYLKGMKPVHTGPRFPL